MAHQTPPASILLIDGDADHARACENGVAVAVPGARFEWVRTLAAGLERLAEADISVVFISLSLLDGQGPTVIAACRAVASPEIIVVGGADEDAVCRQALLQGAADYLLEGHLDSYAFASVMRHIDERAVARHGLHRGETGALQTLNSIGDGVLSTDTAGLVTYMNAAAEVMTGRTSQHALGRTLADVFQVMNAVTRERAPDPLARAIRLNRPVGLSPQAVLVRPDGRETAIEDSAAPIHASDGTVVGAVIVFHDVSVARSAMREMSHVAQHDGLTNLPNRSLMQERLGQAILLAQRRRSHIGVLFLDLDGFKAVNDTLGHDVGDQLLQAVAIRVLDAVRRSDTVSRIGGDEFVVLLPDITSAADAAITAEKIVAALKHGPMLAGHEVTMSASVGISTYPEHGLDAETLVRHADMAMYRAKGLGKDHWLSFDAEIDGLSVSESLDDQLRRVVEARQLRLYYQPKVRLETGVISGAEALLRWQHPELGLLLPEQFLPGAERNGTIVSIGRWVVREACRQLRAWNDAGLPAVPVSVNISALEFRDVGFFHGVQDALDETGVRPDLLEIELTETALVQRTGPAADAIDLLRAAGVRFSIDDFGTGYSALSYLTKFPIDALKLDRSFVRDLSERHEDAIVTSSILAMARRLKHPVVAEGIETSAQLAFLRANGCDEGQGFYFSRPIPPAQFATLLRSGLSGAADAVSVVARGYGP